MHCPAQSIIHRLPACQGRKTSGGRYEHIPLERFRGHGPKHTLYNISFLLIHTRDRLLSSIGAKEKNLFSLADLPYPSKRSPVLARNVVATISPSPPRRAWPHASKRRQRGGRGPRFGHRPDRGGADQQWDRGRCLCDRLDGQIPPRSQRLRPVAAWPGSQGSLSGRESHAHHGLGDRHGARCGGLLGRTLRAVRPSPLCYAIRSGRAITPAKAFSSRRSRPRPGDGCRPTLPPNSAGSTTFPARWSRRPSPGAWFRCPEQAHTLSRDCGQKPRRSLLPRRARPSASWLTHRATGAIPEAKTIWHATAPNGLRRCRRTITACASTAAPQRPGARRPDALGILRHLEHRGGIRWTPPAGLHLQVEAMKIALATCCTACRRPR